ncbi:Gfo/Idh/MocA family protein [Ponticaulis profundi]|uniref:Gfo/Idh/MocA family protein n=1 Tax=Ponticaulis profundi TaxID=2665222 RepID=A0ABW1SDW9_9PROT
MDALKVGVAGAGVFGNYHAQKAAASARTKLTGIFDVDINRAEERASGFGVAAYSQFEELIEQSDAIIVAVPATYHAELTEQALIADRHVLVEKPLALRAKTARRLAGEAITRGKILQVGHQERFVAKAMGMFRIEEAPILMESVRYSPPSPEGRAGDVSVIWDLMIHDLDLAGCLIEGRFEGVKAKGRKIHSDHLDVAEAEFSYSSGAKAILKASRAAEARERTMRVVYPSGEISVDFLTREVINTTPYDIQVDVSATLPDPLGAADESFFSACLGETNSAIPGHGAVTAVAMAEAAETIALV